MNILPCSNRVNLIECSNRSGCRYKFNGGGYYYCKPALRKVVEDEAEDINAARKKKRSKKRGPVRAGALQPRTKKLIKLKKSTGTK